MFRSVLNDNTPERNFDFQKKRQTIVEGKILNYSSTFKINEIVN